MPRVRSLTETDRKNQHVTAQITGMMKAQHIKQTDLADMMHCHKHTIYRRITNPEMLTLAEIRRLKEIFPELVIE